MTDPDETFAELRPLLFTVAYDVLGAVADAEDVVGECYLSWSRQDASTVDDPRAYLVTAVSRRAFNHLRTVRRRRETYIGSWLPEPLHTESDVADDAVLAESVSMAMQIVLETLSPVERVVFVLHEVFGYEHTEIAAVVDRSDVAVRQIAHRARQHVHARRRRAVATPPTDTDDVVARLLLACLTGDVDGLLDVLAPDVVAISDGGGHVAAARRPLVGPEKVARFLLAVARTEIGRATVDLATFNASPAAIFTVDGRVDTVAVFEVHDKKLTGFYAIRNPEKLDRIERTHRLDRGEDTPCRP
ncbi:RNA polymerase sigma-70 factor [Gordonia sp. CPCC 206044]|uniref:RNA polymerase sigma-70 factor n=1 Tax=Gordonia sp. CPCC 206044 TaxID=3140793 RepID=UPI003AF3E73C